MKKIGLSIIVLLIGFVIVGFSPINDEKITNETKVENVSDYCDGWNEGYEDGWKEECGTSSSGHPCQGDVLDCRNTSDPYKCGYSQGYKKGTKDGIKRCGK